MTLGNTLQPTQVQLLSSCVEKHLLRQLSMINDIKEKVFMDMNKMHHIILSIRAKPPSPD